MSSLFLYGILGFFSLWSQSQEQEKGKFVCYEMRTGVACAGGKELATGVGGIKEGSAWGQIRTKYKDTRVEISS